MTFVALLIFTGCGAATQPAPAVLPSVADLDKLASATHSFGTKHLVSKSEGVVTMGDPNIGGDDSWWDVHCQPGSEMEWVIMRIAYSDQFDPEVQVMVDADTYKDIEGSVFFGVADCADDCWVWQDCNEPWYLDNHGQPLAGNIGCYVAPGTDIWSDAGYAYVCVLASGPGSRGICSKFARVWWRD